MSLYVADRLIHQARLLAAEYRREMGRPLPGIGGEIACHDAMRALGLRAKTEETGGYDVIDPSRGHKRIQIKSRTIFDDARGGQRIGQLRLDQDWDSVLLVLMDDNYESYEMHEAERADLVVVIGDVSVSRAKRGALSVARFKNIGRLVWTREHGVEPE
ncbi:conserved hypothetical protein [Gammaproteobacteria bacterium]